MKIIQQGNIEHNLKIKRFECGNCKCVFEADKNEYKSGSQYNETYYFAKCPCCGKNVYEE